MSSTVRIGRTIGRSQFPQIRRHCVKLRRPQPASEFEIIFVLHTTDAVGNNDTSKLLRKRECVIEGDKSSARRSQQMKSINA
jgi:hypothetical protein